MERKALVALLERYHIPYKTWPQHGGKRLEDLLKELARGEARLVERELPSRRGRLKLVREIHTVLVRIYIDIERDGRMARYTLEELKRRKDGQWHRRKVQQASISEKMLPGESVHEAILRAFTEELGLRNREEKGRMITAADLGEVHFQALADNRQFDKSDSYPGIYTDNTLEFATWVMPKAFYASEYREHDQGKLVGFFRWHDVANQEERSVLYG